LQDEIEKYNITTESIYNWDEKGFLISIANITERVISKEALKSGCTFHTSRQQSRVYV